MVFGALLLLPLLLSLSLGECVKRGSSQGRDYEAARREYQKNVNAYYDRYFAQLDTYAEQVQRMRQVQRLTLRRDLRYRQLLEQQAKQRAQLEDVFKNVPLSRRPPPVQTEGERHTHSTEVPFPLKATVFASLT